MKINDVTPPKAEINIDDLSIEELNQLMIKCSQRRERLFQDRRNAAYAEFKSAYRKFREVSPDEQLFRCIEAETDYSGHFEEVEIDVFDVLDDLFN